MSKILWGAIAVFAVMLLISAFSAVPAQAYWTSDMAAGNAGHASRQHWGHPAARHARTHGRRFVASHGGGSGNLVSQSGKRASVSAVALPHFQCLLAKLEGAGYRVDFMGGFGPRSNPSAHPTGNALDINQTGFGRVTRRFPGNIEEMCNACGVYSGAHFGDYGHFEMLNKYGYVNIGRQYAYRHRWRHRHYAGA